MLREDIEQYTKLTGKDGWQVPIIKVGAYLDGYNKGLAVLDKIRAEIEKVIWEDVVVSLDGTDEVRIPRLDPDDVFEIIDKYKTESEAQDEDGD